MKLLTLIFSIYMLGLNIFPCSDDAEVLEEQTAIVSVQSIDADQANHLEGDLCPIFCQCHCCHVHTVVYGEANSDFQDLEIFPNRFFHFENISEEVPHSLLQPPQV